MEEVMAGRKCRYCMMPITMPCERPDCVEAKKANPGQRHELSDAHPLREGE